MQPPKPYREERPWGEFIEFAKNSTSTSNSDMPMTVKILTIKPHEALSLQYHHGRDEFWHVVAGNGTITKGFETFEAEPGQEYWIPRETNHRLEGGTEPLIILEISYGKFEETDIVRVEDRYGRESDAGSIAGTV